MTLEELKLIEYLLDESYWPDLQAKTNEAKRIIRREIRLKTMDVNKSKEEDK